MNVTNCKIGKRNVSPAVEGRFSPKSTVFNLDSSVTVLVLSKPFSLEVQEGPLVITLVLLQDEIRVIAKTLFGFW